MRAMSLLQKPGEEGILLGLWHTRGVIQGRLTKELFIRCGRSERNQHRPGSTLALAAVAG